MPQAHYGAVVGFSVNEEETVQLPAGTDGFSKVTLECLPRTVAGSSLNVIRTLNALGTPAKLLYTVGRDHHADHIARGLAEWTVDAFPLRVRHETSRTIVLVPYGDSPHTRQFLYKPPCDPQYLPDAIREVAEQVQLCQPEFLVATGVRFDDLDLVVELFKGQGATVLNPSLDLIQRHRDDAIALTRRLELMIVNHEEVCAFLGKQPSEFDGRDDIERLASLLFVRALIVTCNSQGSYYCEKSLRVDGFDLLHIPAFPQQVVDPTGTGDVYIGAFLHKRLERASVREAMQFASAAASVKLTKIGGSNVPTKEEVLSLLA